MANENAMEPDTSKNEKFGCGFIFGPIGGGCSGKLGALSNFHKLKKG